MKYDYLIVGAGLYGAVFAHEMAQAGKTSLVIDRRSHVAGNTYTRSVHGINVHEYGAHIFHTSNEEVWAYINRFAKFNHYINSPLAVYKDELYNMPFNMNTFHALWGVRTPEEAQAKIAEQIASLDIGEPQNLEEQALSLVGPDVYEKLIKGYTEKQWGRKCTELPSFIIRRLPLRFTYNNNYFNDIYQGIPIGGYTQIVDRLLDADGITVRLDTDFKDIAEQPDGQGIRIRLAGNTVECERLLYTGAIDEYYDYCYGPLAYRSVRFETEELSKPDFQGNAVVNYTEAFDRDAAEDQQSGKPFTRIIEHKHFEAENNGIDEIPTTIISREYSQEWKPGIEPYYPVNDDENTALYEKYKARATEDEKRGIRFGGRLGHYKYYDMDKVIEAALEAVAAER
ncbi:MAG: UDP-galactopyranose mutase [Lachnospiraceae bacterium]|nr:UDP-galactopyranose mutase [Lachnospiraceae bacterium]